MKNRFKGFTLAEMMVVMLVLTIMLAAAAPIMTKRREVTATDSPWRYSTNGSDAYYGLQANQTAMIGQDEKTNKDLNARLILTGNSDNPYITFKSNSNTTLANMFFKGSNFIIGGPYDTDNPFKIGLVAENTAFGYNALIKNEQGIQNVAIGANALKSNLGDGNIAIGSNTLYSNVAGYDNIAIGRNALMNAKSLDSGNTEVSSQNIAIGSFAMINADYDEFNNIAIGHKSLGNTKSSVNNIAIGVQAMADASTSGAKNIAIGNSALKKYEKNLSGSYGSPGENTVIGTNAMSETQYGYRNTVVGAEAGKKLNNGHNVILGYGALPKSGEDENVVIGALAMENSTSSDTNIAIGYNAMNKFSGDGYNVGIGYQALKDIENGTRVVAIGYRSGSEYLLDGSGDQHLYLGSPAVHNNKKTKGIIEAHHVGNDKYIVLNGDVMITGHLMVNQRVFADAYYADEVTPGVDKNNAFRYTGSLSTDTYSMPTTSSAYKWRGNTATMEYPTSSDKRLKNITGENKAGLEEIKKLNVFNFTFKKDDKKIPHVGVIAQDLRKIFPDAVVEGEDGYLQIRHEDMFYAVVNAVKQLNTIVEALIAEVKVDLAKILKHDEDIAKLQKQNKEIVKQNKELRNKNEELEKRIDKLEKRLEKVLKELDED